MKIAALQKLLEDAEPEGELHFYLGGRQTELFEMEKWTTGTKDAAFIIFAAPPNWRKADD